MFGDTFIEVAFYRVSPEEWAAEIEKVEQEWREAYLRQVPAGMEPDPASLERQAAFGRQARGYDVIYPYNQVVGWVHLECSPHVVKAEAFRVAQARVTRRFQSSRATFEWAGKVIERWFRHEASREIAGAIRADILGLTKKGRLFARRHADLEAFDVIAPYVDWRGLLDLG